MKNLRITAILFCLALPIQATANLAEVICDDTTRLEEQLLMSVGAERQAQGLRAPDALIEIWIVPKNGDWTIVQNYANGTSCIVAMGEHWETLPQEPA